MLMYLFMLGVLLANNTLSPNATHVPVATPITTGYRVIVVAQSINEPTKKGRIFAYDVLDVAINRMKLAWYVDIDRVISTGVSTGVTHTDAGVGENSVDESSEGNVFEPAVIVGNDMLCAGGNNHLLIAYNIAGAATNQDVKVVEVSWGKIKKSWTAKTSSSDILMFVNQHFNGLWVTSKSEGDYLYQLEIASGTIVSSIHLKGLLMGEENDGSSILVTSRLIGFDCVTSAAAADSTTNIGSTSDSCVVFATKNHGVVLLNLVKERIVRKWQLPSNDIVTGQIALLVETEGKQKVGSNGSNTNVVVVVRTDSGIHGLNL